jgi:hypothetical protein
MFINVSEKSLASMFMVKNCVKYGKWYVIQDMDVAMNGSAAEGNMKTGLCTKRDKVKRKGNQVQKEDKHIRKQK